MNLISYRTLKKIMGQHFNSPAGKCAVQLLFGLGASYLMYKALSRARCKLPGKPTRICQLLAIHLQPNSTLFHPRGISLTHSSFFILEVEVQEEDPRVEALKKRIENLQGSNRKNNSDQLCEIARILETLAADVNVFFIFYMYIYINLYYYNPKPFHL